VSLEKLAVLGLGMIGGSIGGAARRVGIPVTGWDPSPEVCTKASGLGLVDSIEPSPEEAVSKATLVVAACPVPQVARLLARISKAARPGTLLTDVGSTKRSILEVMRGKIPPEIEYLGSHPLAGSEKSGPDHADPQLVDRRIVALCPEASTTAAAMERLAGFWKSLGATVVSCPADRHDLLLSLTSHLPHLLAYLLASMPDEEHAPYLAGGFRDMTRLAGSSPQLWMGIFQDNREELLARAREFRDLLDRSISALELPGDPAGDLKGLMDEGWKMRTGWQAR
jgi:cyclohexadieny/prephenate dehydrogenase